MNDAVYKFKRYEDSSLTYYTIRFCLRMIIRKVLLTKIKKYLDPFLPEQPVIKEKYLLRYTRGC